MGRQHHDIGHRKRLKRLAAQQGDGGTRHSSYNILHHCKALVARGLATQAILAGAKIGQKWSRENGYSAFTIRGDDE